MIRGQRRDYWRELGRNEFEVTTMNFFLPFLLFAGGVAGGSPQPPTHHSCFPVSGGWTVCCPGFDDDCSDEDSWVCKQVASGWACVDYWDTSWSTDDPTGLERRPLAGEAFDLADMSLPPCDNDCPLCDPTHNYCILDRAPPQCTPCVDGCHCGASECECDDTEPSCEYVVAAESPVRITACADDLAAVARAEREVFGLGLLSPEPTRGTCVPFNGDLLCGPSDDPECDDPDDVWFCRPQSGGGFWCMDAWDSGWSTNDPTKSPEPKIRVRIIKHCKLPGSDSSCPSPPPAPAPAPEPAPTPEDECKPQCDPSGQWCTDCGLVMPCDDYVDVVTPRWRAAACLDDPEATTELGRFIELESPTDLGLCVGDRCEAVTGHPWCGFDDSGESCDGDAACCILTILNVLCGGCLDGESDE